MGIMNSDQHFLAAKKITKAPYAVPQNTREAIPISLIYPDGIFEIEPGPGMRQFDKAYTFADINYLSLDDEEKERFLEEKWMKLLNLLTTDWKIVIANERRSPEQFQQQVAFPNNQKWAKEANEWMREGICQGNTEIMQKKYLIITCRKYSYEEARLYFAAMDAQLDTIFQAMRSTLTPLNAKERLRILMDVIGLDGKKNLLLPGILSIRRDAGKISLPLPRWSRTKSICVSGTVMYLFCLHRFCPTCWMKVKS